MITRHNSARICCIFAALFLSLALLLLLRPFLTPTAASKVISESVDNFPNYDIRTDKAAGNLLAAFRSSVNRTSSDVGKVRFDISASEAELRRQLPSLNILNNIELGTPEVIAPDVKSSGDLLTAKTSMDRVSVLKNFLSKNSGLLGARSEQLSELKVAADYTNPDGKLSFVELDQEINGIPVFRGEIKAGFTRSNELVRVINNLAPGLDYQTLSTDFGDPIVAAQIAAVSVGADPTTLGISNFRSQISNSQAVTFGSGDFAPKAEKLYFPTEPGVAVPTWRVLVWLPTRAFYVIVHADSGTVLWRKNITEDQTQPATYSVYANLNAMVNIAANPFPIKPAPTSLTGVQGGAIPRTPTTRIGNEPPYTFNDLGWITDGNNTTDGNNVQAGLDRELPNTGSPANPNDIDSNGMAIGSPARAFDFPVSPGVPSNPSLGIGDSPLPAGQSTVCQAQGTATPPTDFQKASVTNLFYITNVFHDEMYRLGFTEQARNFQHNNFGRGGLGNDRLSAQDQDCSSTNNANFTTPADGTRPQMQMYIWTAPTPNFDSAFDASIVLHENTHGVSGRLHGNATGLFNDFARGMGEGWSDFYALCLLSEPTDAVDGVYPVAAYDTYLMAGVGYNNNYYGVRRFPMAVMSATGGAKNRPHNPLTFADIDSSQMDLSDGAFPPRFTGNADQVHNIGEVWASALWEVRARFIQRLGWAQGNRHILQLVTDGMKLAPLSPDFIAERDAIIASAQASGTSQDVADLWAGFAVRGLGSGATIQNPGGTSTGGTNTIRVNEAFDLPNLMQTPEISVSDDVGDNDGYPEPGESVRIAIPITNYTGRPATGITLQMSGERPVSYGNLSSGLTASREVIYNIPASATCGGLLSLTFEVNSDLGQVTFTRQIFVGKAVSTSSKESFDNVPTQFVPPGWTSESIGGGIRFTFSDNGPDTPPSSMFAQDPATVGGGTDLTSPPIDVTAAGATLTFRNKYATESGWDGGLLEISIAGGAFQDIVTAGGNFIQNGYNGFLNPGINNPLSGRPAWTGSSGGYVTTVVELPASATSKIVRLRWRFGADDNTAVTGWNIDTISFDGAGFVTSFGCLVSLRSRADFDGDGRTDSSIFRPQDGTWWLNRTTAGVRAQVWGLNGDIPVPGDYDNDGKTDTAVFRPAATARIYVLNSSDSTVTTFGWGTSGDLPVTGDFNGDGRADYTVWRPTTGVWYTAYSGGGTLIFPYGSAGDLALAIDPDGDGAANPAIYRPSEGRWYITRPGITNYYVVNFGSTGDRPVPADYDGDNKDDIAVFRPLDGRWYVLSSKTGITTVTAFGQNGDAPVPGDYDGDGRDDIAIYRGGTWYMYGSTSGVQIFPFGLSTDVPIPSRYLP